MYAKVFSSIFDGSMRGHSDLILVFVNILCHADQDGMVDRHWRAIADETGLPDERVRAALLALESPDTESRTRTDDGRRLRRIDPERDWGWQIVNFKHYRALRNDDERREYMRNLMRNKRKQQATAPVSNLLAPLAHAEAEAEAEAKKIAVKGKPSPPASRIKIVDQQWIEELRPDCKKQGIDLDAEIIKAKRWLLKAPGRKFTQKYFINWLNRCDKTLDIKTGRKSYSNQKDDIRDRAIAEIMDRLKTEHLATPEESFMEIAARLALSDKYKDIPGAVDKAVWTLNYERKA